MKKTSIIVLSLALILALALVAGCGSSDNKAQQPAPAAQMSMPMGDPMPMMKDMDKQLQDLMKQVKAGQTMDAQKTVGQFASNCDQVTPHISDNSLQDKMHMASADLKGYINSGKIDQTIVDGKVKAMQDLMKQANVNLQNGMHKH